MTVPDAVAQTQHAAYLKLQVTKLFPFTSPGYAVISQGRQASIYAWDQAAVAAEIKAQGLPANTAVVPETFIRSQGADGLTLVKMLEGVEGQFWKNGFLVATRWWPGRPSPFEWKQFARSVGGVSQTGDDVPEPVAHVLLDRPWIETPFSLDQISSVLQSARAIQFMATAAVCVLLFVFAQAAVLALREGQVVSEIKALRAANKEFGQNRAQAFSNLDDIKSILALDIYPPQIDVIYAALALLQPRDVRVMSWSFDRGNLDITVRGKQQLDPTAFITLFERDDKFQGVSGTLGGPERDLQLKMTVEPKQAEPKQVEPKQAEPKQAN
ncbi:MAG: hypothetical protein JNM81_08485 [Rhodospirillaceae bacterium]|nr:hypothetical protein [Rhodospirillaceae bacterium]